MCFLVYAGLENREFLKVRNFKLILLILTMLLFSGCITYEGMTPEMRVTQIQKDLITLGYMSGKADGVLESNTRTAITKFQEENGMPADGGVSRDLLIKSNRAAIQKRYAELGAAQQSPAVLREQPEPTSTQNDVCAYASWDGVVQNLADLFVCDQGRAIASLSAGRQVDFHVTSVAFHEGKLYAKSFIQDSRANAAGQSLQKRNNFDWGSFHRKTQSPYFTFSCILPGARAEDIRPGSTARLNAKLVSYSGTSGSFECN